MSDAVCPYYDTNYKKCNFFDTTQTENDKEMYCLSRDNWKRCVNYTNRSYSEKVEKKLRPNPDL